MHALLIGIDHHTPNPWCTDLHGAVADVEAVWLHLLSTGVPEERIVRLVSPRPESGVGLGTLIQRPSWQVMVEAIVDLGERAAASGEGALLYYSGHGGRARTWLPEQKGRQGFDEGLVPWDLSRENPRLLRDIELTWLLERLVRRGARVTVILDSCHGGGMIRSSGRRARPRSLRSVLGGRRGSDGLGPLGHGDRPLAPLDELAKTWGRVHHRAEGRMPDPKTLRHGRSKGGWVAARLVRGAGAVVLSACRSGGLAYERDFGEGPRGVFTWHLLDLLDKAESGESWEGVWTQLAQRLGKLHPRQRPIFEGDVGALGAGFLQTAGQQGVDRPTREVPKDLALERCPSDAWSALRKAFADRAKAGGLVARLAILDPGYRRGSTLLSGDLRFEAGRPQVSTGRWVAVEVANPGRPSLYLGLLDLRPDGTVEVIYPLRGVERIRGRWWRRLPLEIYLPEGHPGGPETLVAIAGPEPLDLRRFRTSEAQSGNALEKPTLDPDWVCALVDFEVTP